MGTWVIKTRYFSVLSPIYKSVYVTGGGDFLEERAYKNWAVIA